MWTSDAIWRHRAGSTLAQVMDCCLIAPRHYLNQCWLLIREVLWQSPESNFTVSAEAAILCDEFENYTFKITATSLRGQWVNMVFLDLSTLMWLMLWDFCCREYSGKIRTPHEEMFVRVHALTLARTARCWFCTIAERYVARPPSSMDGNRKNRWMLESKMWNTNRWLSGILWYLQHNCVGDTIVYH